MSVLIKNTTMPKNCIECPMQFGGWCYVCPPDIDERVAETVEEAVKQGKPDWCPLVEIKGDDVAPVVHGHWIFDPARSKDGRKHYWCSNCHLNAVNVDFDINRIRCCMFCGAKMDEEAES